MNKNVFEYNSIVQYTDVNENNELSKKGLLRILLEVAGLHSDYAGYGLNQTPQTHLAWMILNWKVKSFYNPHWNSKLSIKTWASDFTRSISRRQFEVYDEDNNPVAIASSKWILVNAKTHSISKFTPEILEAYGNGYNKHVFDPDINDKEKEPENSEYIYEYRIMRRDLDTNHHVDNLFYLDYAYDAIPKDFYNKNFENIEIMYKKQLLYGDLIKCFYSFDKENNTHIVTIKNENLDIVHAIVKMF